MAYEECIKYRETLYFSAPHETHRWVDVATFDVNVSCSDVNMLKALLADDYFAHSYIAPRPDPIIEGDRVHGPFILSGLSADMFAQIDGAQAEFILAHFTANCYPPSTLTEMRLEGIISLIYQASAIYELQAESAPLHEQRELFHIPDDFAEIVVINRRESKLVDIAMAED